ncbi:hydrogenase nickel incorporation protein HypB [Amycolatopsis pigmentata]|uniref:Hydrogenase nickel incorporation protein HypB n=1 Tax=Amycolatopsis pigmentata TaxID=450801 RepID=A0ABW5FLX0_9PSEU
MCGTCGCGGDEHGHGETVPMEHRVLARNDHLAEHNRTWLRERSILMVNLMSSPGSGKTTLLERVITGLLDRVPVAVIEGDQATPLDADRIRATGCPALQVNTGSGCHLDAGMLAGALDELDPAPGSVLFVENVGNLVCPALFDLGEDHRAVVMSVTEGEDKPLKYPYMFRTADVVLLNKVDLLPHVDFDPVRFRERLSRVNPAADVLPVSALRGDGLGEWDTWLADRLRRLTEEAGIPR